MECKQNLSIIFNPFVRALLCKQNSARIKPEPNATRIQNESRSNRSSTPRRNCAASRNERIRADRICERRSCNALVGIARHQGQAVTQETRHGLASAKDAEHHAALTYLPVTPSLIECRRFLRGRPGSERASFGASANACQRSVAAILRCSIASGVSLYGLVNGFGLRPTGLCFPLAARRARRLLQRFPRIRPASDSDQALRISDDRMFRQSVRQASFEQSAHG